MRANRPRKKFAHRLPWNGHFNVHPDEVTWGHVGTLEHYAELLKRITDSAFLSRLQPNQASSEDRADLSDAFG